MTERNAYAEMIATERFLAGEALARAADNVRVLQRYGFTVTDADRRAITDAESRWRALGGGLR